MIENAFFNFKLNIFSKNYYSLGAISNASMYLYADGARFTNNCAYSAASTITLSSGYLSTARIVSLIKNCTLSSAASLARTGLTDNRGVLLRTTLPHTLTHSSKCSRGYNHRGYLHAVRHVQYLSLRPQSRK